MWLWVWVVELVALAVAVFALALWSSSRNGVRSRSGRLASQKQCRAINAGVTPAGISVVQDVRRWGSHGFVADNNNYGLTGSDAVTVFDTRSLAVRATIQDASFSQPYTVTLDETRGLGFVTNSASTTVTVFSLVTYAVTAVIPGFDGPSGLVLGPAPSRNYPAPFAYVNNYGSAAGVGSGNGTTLRVVNLDTLQITGSPITVGQAPAALARLGPLVYCINYTTGLPAAGTMSIVDTTTNAVVGTIAGFSGPFGLALLPGRGKRGPRAYVTNFGSNNFWPYGTTVSVVDLVAQQILVNVELFGVQPSGIAIAGDYAYVSLYNTLYADPTDFSGLTAGQGTVVAVDVRSNEVDWSKSRIVGQSPANVAVQHEYGRAFVSNFTSGTVSEFSV
jgi:hypothetical protein